MNQISKLLIFYMRGKDRKFVVVVIAVVSVVAVIFLSSFPFNLDGFKFRGVLGCGL